MIKKQMLPRIILQEIWIAHLIQDIPSGGTNQWGTWGCYDGARSYTIRLHVFCIGVGKFVRTCHGRVLVDAQLPAWQFAWTNSNPKPFPIFLMCSSLSMK